jgi:hypothetical protein
MNTAQSPSVFFAPATTLSQVPVNQTTYSGNTWTGLATVAPGTPSGRAVLVVSGATDTSGNLMAPATSLFTIDLTPPPAPVNTAVSYISAIGNLQVSWQAAPGKAVVGYNLYRSTVPMTSRLGLAPIQAGLAGNSTVDLPGPDSPFVYYAVTGVDASRNESALSANASFGNPLAPIVTSPAANATVYSTTVVVRGLSQPGAQIEVLSVASGGVETPLGSGPVGSDRTFALPVLLPKGANNLKVQTRSTVLTQLVSPGALLSLNVVIFPRGVSGLQALPGDTVVDLSWTANQDPTVAGYRIYRDRSSVPLNAALVPATQTQWRDFALTDGRPYTYTITAVDNIGLESPASAPIQATPAAGPGRGN